jgi:hypothetical protein
MFSSWWRWLETQACSLGWWGPASACSTKGTGEDHVYFSCHWQKVLEPCSASLLNLVWSLDTEWQVCMKLWSLAQLERAMGWKVEVKNLVLLWTGVCEDACQQGEYWWFGPFCFQPSRRPFWHFGEEPPWTRQVTS